MLRLFFSYSHRDEALRNELQFHLESLKHQGILETWHDRQNGAGEEVDKEIDEQLEKADIILLLVSSYFIGSPYCYGIEMQRAMERHDKREARVIPVILRPCDWHDLPFGKLLATPPDGKPVTKYPDQHDAFYEVEQAIREAAKRLSRSKASTRQSQSAGTSGISDNVDPAPPEPIRRPGVRSGDLRIKKQFTDHEKDQFLEEAFEYIAKYFEGSLLELQERNPEVTYRSRRIDANHFAAAVYRDGERVSGCRIWTGGDRFLSNSIAFSFNESGNDGSMNESLTVDDDGYSLFLKPMGIAMPGRAAGNKQLTNEGGAEYYWSMLIEPLQR
jgi:TIR domain